MERPCPWPVQSPCERSVSMPQRSGQRRPLSSGKGDGDDLPPSGEEAQAQRKAAVKPLIWLLLGIVLVALFVALLHVGTPLQPHATGQAPLPPHASSGPPQKQAIGAVRS